MTPGPLVIKLGGRALDHSNNTSQLWDAIASLALRASATSNSTADNPAHGVALVHGGGSEVDTHLARLGMTTTRNNGLRVTPDDQIDEVVAVLRGRVNTRLVGHLQSRGVPAVGLGLSDGATCVCAKHEPDGVDLGRVGTVAWKQHQQPSPETGSLWRDLLAGGRVPVLCSIGLDAMGKPLNVNADDAAAAVAGILHAHMLVLLTDVPGILDRTGTPIQEAEKDSIETLIADGTIAGGMIPKARAAVAAAESSGVPTVIASWKHPEHLAALAGNTHVGTRVLPVRRRPVGTSA
ncbi:MAG: acetylglutamate kinase [Planctomycetota bacterium]|nr:acetylglutamate kinase [Planctomycetota bacterium]